MRTLRDSWFRFGTGVAWAGTMNRVGSLALLILVGSTGGACGSDPEQPEQPEQEIEDPPPEIPDCSAGTIVPSDDELVLTSQAMVDAMNGCEHVDGSLFISGTDIRDLDGLTDLVSVTRELKIRTNPNLSSLAGLNALERVDWGIAIVENAKLTSLEGLDSLRTLGRGIEIESNPLLVSLAGLPEALDLLAPSEEGDQMIRIRFNEKLESLDGFPSFGPEQPDLSLFVAENPSLTDISAASYFESLAVVWLRGNESLFDVEFSALSSSGLKIETTKLTHLDGFGALEVADYISIEENSDLQSLAGLSALSSAEVLRVVGNQSMTTLGDFPDLRNIGEFVVSENENLSALGDFSAAVGEPYLVILRDCPLLEDFSGFPEFTRVEENFALSGLPLLKDLSAFDAIASVERNLNIYNNGALDQEMAQTWAESRDAEFTKVDGNEGTTVPHVGECPWQEDLECDEPQGTGLCEAGSDPGCLDQGG